MSRHTKLKSWSENTMPYLGLADAFYSGYWGTVTDLGLFHNIPHPSHLNAGSVGMLMKISWSLWRVMLHNVTNNQAPSEDLQYTVKMSWSTLKKQHCDTNETAKLITHEFISMSNLNLLTLQVKNRKIVLYWAQIFWAQ